MRPFAELGASDLIALLSEHCTHPQAHVIASELDFRTTILAGIAQGHTDLEPMRGHVPYLLMGVPSADGVKRPTPRSEGMRGVPPTFLCDIDESGGLADDLAGGAA